MKAIHYQIAEITFSINSDISLRALHSSKLKRFQINKNKPEVNIYFKMIPNHSMNLPPFSKDEIMLIRKCLIYQQNTSINTPLLNSAIFRSQLNIYLERMETISIEIHTYSIVIFDFFKCELFAFYSPNISENIDDFRFGPLLFTPFLPSFSAVMLHSAGVIRKNRAALFLAPDEGGKTTALKLSPNSTELCDDQNIIRKQGKKFVAHSTPWGSHLINPLKADVGAFFLLKKGNNFKLTLLDSKEILSYLLNEHLLNYICIPKKYKPLYFNFIYDLSFNIPGYLLSFTKDYIDWDAIDRVMR